jgi:hypothetical protein
MAAQVIEISMGAKAQHVIEDELKRNERTIQRGREVGGWLWARQDSAWWSGLEVVEAGGPGPDVRLGRDVSTRRA